MSGILIWLAESLMSYGASYIFKKLGEPEVRIRFENALTKIKSLPADPNPSPAQERNPPHYEG